jgi:hypothetical protein
MPRARNHRAAVPVLVVAALVLLCCVPAAEAADGRRLLPPSDPLAELYQTQPVVSGPVVAFFVIPDGGDRTVWACNAGAVPPAAWSLRELPGGSLLMGEQQQPRVLTHKGIVRIVWRQTDLDGEYDLFLWEGTTSGVAAAGFPKKLVDHPYGRNAFDPSIGVTRVGADDHVVVAWSDGPSINGPAGFAVVRWLDLTADTGLDGTPDYRDTEFDPTVAGTQADPSAAAYQWQPDVGPKGVFWLDAVTQGPGAAETSVARLDLAKPAPVAGLFHSEPAGSGFDADGVRATGTGAAWMRVADYPGSGLEPVAKQVGGAAKVVTFLNNPWQFDVEGSAYALTEGHGGTTSGDPDIVFYAAATGQKVGVCTYGDAESYNWFKEQREPGIGAAPGGYRVVWADTRHSTSVLDLRLTLYQALVPTVTLAADRATVRRGGSVTLTTKVTPAHGGFAVRFQTGKRNAMTTGWGTSVWFTSIATKAKKSLGSGSKTSWKWKPTKRGTYYWRVSFGGSSKYVGRAGHGANHVPNVSRWVKIVVN